MSLKKIVVIGPESTGKSTLSAALAQELDTVWVPEYARSYIEGLKRSYNEADLLTIAKGQVAHEDELADRANNYLICDTDLQIIKVWSEAKYDRCDTWILEEIARRQYDLYLLTYIDIPWEPDPQREHPDLRTHFYNVYRDVVQNSGAQWIDVRGTHRQRLDIALQAIHQL